MSTDRFLATLEGPATPHLAKGEVADLRGDVSNAFARVATEIDGSGAHTHANKSTLDLVSAEFTTGLKSTYDGYAAGKENAGVAAGLVSGHESTYDHTDFLKASDGVATATFTTNDGKTVTVVDGQITIVSGP